MAATTQEEEPGVNEDLSLTDLPEALVLRVFSYLSAPDLVRLQQVCKCLNELAGSPVLWRSRLREDWDVKYEVQGSFLPPSHWKELYSIVKQETGAPKSCRFRGVFTDGGCDATNHLFWVDNLFAPSDCEAYCTTKGDDVTCVAILEPGKAVLDAQNEKQRQYMIERCSLASAIMFGHVAQIHQNGANGQHGPGGGGPQPFHIDADVSRWSRHELEAFFVHLFHLAGHGMHQIGDLMYGRAGERRAREEARVRALVHRLQQQAAARANPDQSAAFWTDPTDPLRVFSAQPLPVADTVPRLAVLSQIRLSRVGQLSCPVSCGAILLGKLSSGDLNSEDARAVIGRVAAAPACRALAGLTSLQAVLDAAAEGLLPPVLNVTREPAGTYVEFDVPGRGSDPLGGVPSASALSLEDSVAPVVWFQFSPMGPPARRFGGAPAAAAAAAVAAQEDVSPARDKMMVALKTHHAGNVCIVRLLSAENLMNDYGDDHPEPNIDMNGVQLIGGLVTLPADAILGC